MSLFLNEETSDIEIIESKELTCEILSLIDKNFTFEECNDENLEEFEAVIITISLGSKKYFFLHCFIEGENHIQLLDENYCDINMIKEILLWYKSELNYNLFSNKLFCRKQVDVKILYETPLRLCDLDNMNQSLIEKLNLYELSSDCLNEDHYKIVNIWFNKLYFIYEWYGRGGYFGFVTDENLNPLIEFNSYYTDIIKEDEEGNVNDLVIWLENIRKADNFRVAKIKHIPIEISTLRIPDYDNELTFMLEFPNKENVLYHCSIDTQSGEKQIIKICDCEKYRLNEILSYEFERRKGYKPTFKQNGNYKTVFSPYTKKDTKISDTKEEFMVFIGFLNVEIYTFKNEITRTY
uniref:Uncharacterized protein n=1 Tax=viral metagenome TaxID=1070528 RepID=A0A6C0BEW3_9ZZZZ